MSDRFTPFDQTLLDKPICSKPDASPTDPISPPHYQMHASGIECIQITENMGFNLGNAVKYIWRADLKHNRLEDLRKARWYIDRELQRLAREELA